MVLFWGYPVFVYCHDTTMLDSVWAFLRANSWWQMLDSMMHIFSRSATDICI